MNRLRFWVALDIILLILFAAALLALRASLATDLPAQALSTEPVTEVALRAEPPTDTPTLPPDTPTFSPSPTPTFSPTATPTDTPTSVYPIRYTVREGDYLSLIAQRYGVSYSGILAANLGIRPSIIVPGQVIIIPDPSGTADTLDDDDTSTPLPATTRPPATELAAAVPSSTPTLAPKTVRPPTATPTRAPAVAANPVPVAASAKRYIPPPRWILGPSQGSGEDDKFISDLIWYLDENRIPITSFHFDSDRWQSCANNGEWRWGDNLLQKMRSHNPPIRALFWILPIITTNCREYGEAADKGYFIRNGDGSPMVTRSWQGSGSWIDFNNPAAVAYWHSLLDRIFSRAQGVIGGFYTDDTPLDSAYSDAFVRDLVDYTRSKVPDGDVVMKSYGSGTPDDAFLSKYGHVSYVNDLESNFAGMREGIRRVLNASTILPAPFNEFTGYAMRVPDAETYIRRMHWGAFQPVMENDSLPKNGVPWDPQYPPQVLQAYQYYATLHWELVPFFHTYDELAYRNSWPIFQQPNASRYSTVLGKEFFIQYVTDYMQSIQVTLPGGQWINYWNEQEMFTGPATISYPVPLGREPIFIANGAIIPMQVRDGTTGHGTNASAGALTVNVFPSGRSSFSYFDLNQRWLVFTVKQAGNSVTLCTSAAPSQPLIYRIARSSSAPGRVTTSGGAVGVNESWGRALPALGSEAAVDGAAEGWFFDAARQHLIVKLTQLGSSCP